jgi:arylsulfatase
MAFGALLGYAAASGQLASLWQTNAAAQPSESGPAGGAGPNCCSEGADRDLLLAWADGGAARQEGGGQPAGGGKKPNILMIMGDDIGWFNPSCYHSGIMGYQTPNIDRIAKEGARFTDWYGQQSCTAGRAAFITGQSPIRTGLTKVGLPGADLGLQK